MHVLYLSIMYQSILSSNLLYVAESWVGVYPDRTYDEAKAGTFYDCNIELTVMELQWNSFTILGCLKGSPKWIEHIPITSNSHWYLLVRGLHGSYGPNAQM